MIKVIAFDVFGTVFDMATASRREVAAYVAHVKQGEWQPLSLPSSWSRLKAHPDASGGIEQLRTRFVVVALSNCPVRLLIDLSRRNDIVWDAIIPLEAYRVYKPHLTAYPPAWQLTGVDPSEVLMVTANPTFGDVEAAQHHGMQHAVIRTIASKGFMDIKELAAFVDDV